MGKTARFGTGTTSISAITTALMTAPFLWTPFGVVNSREATGYESGVIVMDFASDAAMLTLMAFVLEVLQPPRRAARVAWVVVATPLVLDVIELAHRPLHLHVATVDVVGLVAMIGLITWFTIRAARSGSPDARLLLAGIGFFLAFVVGGTASVNLAADDKNPGLGALLWFAAAGLALATTLIGIVVRRAARNVEALRQSHQASRRFVPAAFLAALGKDDVVDVGRGESTAQVMTVLFADIRGFTALSERLGPRATLPS